MANQIVCVLAETYGLRIYATMLPLIVRGSIQPQTATDAAFSLVRPVSGVLINFRCLAYSKAVTILSCYERVNLH